MHLSMYYEAGRLKGVDVHTEGTSFIDTGFVPRVEGKHRAFVWLRITSKASDGHFVTVSLYLDPRQALKAFTRAIEAAPLEAAVQSAVPDGSSGQEVGSDG